MFRARLIVAALLLIPTLASAQRKGKMGGEKEADWNKVTEKGPSAGGPTISAKDFENTSPFKFFLDKKKDIQLTDAQLATLKQSDVALKELNRERFVLIDSLKRDAKPRTSSGTPADEDLTRMALARDALDAVVKTVQASFDSAAKATLPTLEQVQQPPAQKVLEKYSEEMQDMLRSKMGRGGSGGGVRPSGRGGL